MKIAGNKASVGSIGCRASVESEIKENGFHSQWWNLYKGKKKDLESKKICFEKRENSIGCRASVESEIKERKIFEENWTKKNLFLPLQK